VFHKGGLLYLLDRARGAIRTESLAVVVEGYVDAIRLHRAGITLAVAPLGTALTPEQVRVLRRYTKHVLLSYDADVPGLRSTFRAGDELLRQGASVSVVTLPAGEDPDTLVARGGASAFRELMAQAVDLFERKIQLLDRKNLFATLEGRRRALDRLLPTVRAAADPITRELYISRAAEKTGVAKSVLEQEAAREMGRAQAPAPVGEGRGEPGRPGRPPDRFAALPRDVPSERAVLQLMLTDPVWIARAQAELTLEHFHHPIYREIATALFAGQGRPPTDDLAATWERLSQPAEGTFDAEAEFSSAAAWLKDRPRQERLEEIDRLMALAGPSEQDTLLAEKVRLKSEGEMRYRRKALKPEREPS